MQNSVGKVDVIGKNIIENQGKKCVRKLIQKRHLKTWQTILLFFSHYKTKQTNIGRQVFLLF